MQLVSRVESSLQASTRAVRRRAKGAADTRLLTALALVGLAGAATLLGACAPPIEEAPGEESAWAQNVGSIRFPTSASPPAQEHFLRGVAILHSFGYKQARAEFQRAQEIEPDFAMAYWGESLCYNHPLLPERDLESPREVLARLGPTPEARAAKAPTKREKGFLKAAELLFGEGGVAERRIAYMEAMSELYEDHPDDPEVAAFYSLALLAAVGPLDDDTFRLNVEAGAIAMRLLGENPDHPGAAHYLIHAFDDPIHAPLALPAAWRFAEIAPAVSHARHMPSHIFIQRGLWQEVSKSNDSAYAAALDLWQPGDRVGDLVHSLDWGHYGDLQRGDVAKARRWETELEGFIERSEGAAMAKSTARLLRARTAVETDSWQLFDLDDDEASAAEILVTGVAAARAGNLALARKAESRLGELAAEEVDSRSTFSRGTKPIQVARHEVAALLEIAEGRHDRALRHLDTAVEIAESMGPPRGPASPVKPAHELYGEVLLELDRPEDAVERFQASLRRTPNRGRSLLGLARAQARVGDSDRAAVAYRQLIEAWEGRDELAGVQEARRFLQENSA